MIDMAVLKKLSEISVLLVEDDEMAREALEQSLAMYCKSVKTSKDGVGGYEEFIKGSFDVLITDINLPEFSGIELASRIKNLNPAMPIIIITSYDSGENILKSMEVGAYTYIKKPFKIEELQIALLMAIKGCRQKIINLQSGFSYDLNQKILYKDGKEVVFTKTEARLFHLFVNNINVNLSYEAIENSVWNDKGMTQVALRLCIKKLRIKIRPICIENISAQGYVLRVLGV